MGEDQVLTAESPQEDESNLWEAPAGLRTARMLRVTMFCNNTSNILRCHITVRCYCMSDIQTSFYELNCKSYVYV